MRAVVSRFLPQLSSQLCATATKASIPRRPIHTVPSLSLVSHLTETHAEEHKVRISSAIHPPFVGPPPVVRAASSCSTTVDLSAAAEVPASMENGYRQLLEFATQHAFWRNDIYKNRRELTWKEWKLYFEQDYFDSASFTRYIGGLMWRCDNDLLRSKLTHNLNEEAGEHDLEERHAEILRKFLTRTMGTKLEKLDILPGTRTFVESYLQNTGHADPLYCAAFLSLGTEGMVSPMFQRLVDGMLHGVAKSQFKTEDLRYFHIHIGCDDAHAGTLAEIMFHYAGRYRLEHPEDPEGWVRVCQQAADAALTLRGQFFDAIYAEILLRRKQTQTAAAAARQSQPAHQPSVHTHHQQQPPQLELAF